MADLNAIVRELKHERDRISSAIEALESIGPVTRAGRTRGARKRRRMSAEARAKIAAAQRARWAKQKKTARG